MSTVYSTFFTNSPVAKAKPPLIVPAGLMTCFQIGFPANGFITKLVAAQLAAAAGGGTAVPFSIDLFTSMIPYPPGNYAASALPADILDPYRVQVPPTAPLTATAGQIITLTPDDIGTPYRNLDGSVNEEQRWLYLLINPTGAITITQWIFFLECRTERRS
jgi:hypothetical protein